MKMLRSDKAEDFLFTLNLLEGSSLSVDDKLGALAKLFYRLVKTITNEKQLAFRNFYARFKYLLSQLPLSQQGSDNLDAFRRFLKEGKGSGLPSKDLAAGLSVTIALLELCSGMVEKEGDALREGYFSRLFPIRNYSALTNLKVLCSSFSELSREDGRPYFVLHAFDLLHLSEEVDLYIRQHEHYDFTGIRRLLAPDMILQLHGVRFLGDRGNCYETSFDSLITIEPDYLVDASSIAECFSNKTSNSETYFLSQLVSDLPGEAALKGSMVGYFLDEMVRRKGKDREEIYQEAQKAYAMKAAQLGKTTMLQIRNSIYQEHLPNIDMLVKREKEKGLWIEPTYFSAEYGLQGRIDLLAMHNNGDAKDIFELKSGSPSNPNYQTAWLNHKMQVVCYDMLLSSTYPAGRKGANEIFYSKCQVIPDRNLVSEDHEKKWVLEVRNEIVAQLYRLAARDFGLLHKFHGQGIAGLPPFKEQALQEFRLAYNPGRIASAYYEEMIAFLLRELINAKVGDQLKEDEEEHSNGSAGLWLDPLGEKEQEFRVLYDLLVTDKNEEEGEIVLNLTRQIDHSFRKGDIVIMYPKVGGSYHALRQHILKGSLKEIRRDRLVVALFNKQTDYGFIDGHVEWAVEPDIFERNYWSAISCLFNLLKATDRCKRLLFGHERPVFDAPGSSGSAGYVNKELKDKEAAVIGQALAAKDYFLLQGPPGTGKTSTFLLNYLRESLKRSDKPIFVLAFTNKAVDKICHTLRSPRMGEAVPYLRIGSRHVADDQLFSAQLADNDPDSWRRLIGSHRVFVSTTASFQNQWQLLKQFVPFSQVVVDEASQLTEAALSGVLALFGKFILIGDHKQLPAVVTQDERMCRTENKYLNQLGITDLRISLFERMIRNAKLKGWTEVYGQLQHHYRMHTRIADLISRHYTEGLIAGLPEQQEKPLFYSLPEGHPLQGLTKGQLLFIETPQEGTFKKNEQEARIAAGIAGELISLGIVKPAEIGIIVPFRAQIAAIKRYLDPKLLDDEDFVVDTVERYQGDERKIILFSTTICHARQVGAIQSIVREQGEGPGMLRETDRKLLVSISRAEQQLIFLGNSEALQGSPLYAEVLDRIRERGGFLTGSHSELRSELR